MIYGPIAVLRDNDVIAGFVVDGGAFAFCRTPGLSTSPTHRQLSYRYVVFLVVVVVAVSQSLANCRTSAVAMPQHFRRINRLLFPRQTFRSRQSLCSGFFIWVVGTPS
jgi:hypothetical protein